MMEQLGCAEDEMLEKDHELAQVKEDRDKHFRVILQQQERLAREILLVSQQPSAVRRSNACPASQPPRCLSVIRRS